MYIYTALSWPTTRSWACSAASGKGRHGRRHRPKEGSPVEYRSRRLLQDPPAGRSGSKPPARPLPLLYWQDDPQTGQLVTRRKKANAHHFWRALHPATLATGGVGPHPNRDTWDFARPLSPEPAAVTGSRVAPGSRTRPPTASTTPAAQGDS